MPADFLPLPPGFNSAPRGANNNTPAPAATTSTTTITDLRQLSQQEFEDLAQQHNQASGIARDPFDAILDGIPERAQLRPEKKQPESYYLGPQGLRPFGRYAQAWKKLQRGFAGQLDALEPVVKVCVCVVWWLRRRAALRVWFAEVLPQLATSRELVFNSTSRHGWGPVQGHRTTPTLVARRMQPLHPS